MRLRTHFSDHKPVTLRAQHDKFSVRHDARTRTITLTLARDPRQQTVLWDHEAFEYAGRISVRWSLGLGTQMIPLTRDQAFRLARVLRFMHHPAAEAITYESWGSRRTVRVTRDQGLGIRDVCGPPSKRAIWKATRAAWRSTLRGYSAHAHLLFHSRITHYTALDRQAEARFLREAKGRGRYYTFAEICANEHLPFPNSAPAEYLWIDDLVSATDDVSGVPTTEGRVDAPLEVCDVQLVSGDHLQHPAVSHVGTAGGTQSRGRLQQVVMKIINALR